ncbi:MAG: glycosyltransferase [Desulfuromonas sp.]|nr:glycosyltransferase [Desulfuromonas sp.]
MNRYHPDHKALSASGLFAADWYLARYPDVAAAGIDPLTHYLQHGADEGRDPGPGFSTNGYRVRYHEELAISGLNPLLHYLQLGRADGCDASPLFKRNYRNMAGYLKYALLNPLVPAPFTGVEKECFALMDKVGEWLCRKQAEAQRPPLISVIMPVYNRAGVVGAAIQSVLNQSYRHFELIVVDDGSLDESVEVVRSFADTRIRLLEIAERKGVSFARNRGLSAARGELIAYLDSDNDWLPDYLGATAGAFQVLPDADAAYSGQYLYRGDAGEPFAVRFGCCNPSLLENNNYIDLNCLVHRRGILDAIGGGFREEMRRLEDWELILRIARRGTIYSVPVLQSRYHYAKVANTATATEDLGLARKQIAAHQVLLNGNDAGIDKPATKVVVFREQRRDAGDAGRHDGAPRSFPADDGISYVAALCPLAVNRGVSEADPGSDILLLAGGSTATPDAIRRLQACAHSNDAIAIVTPGQVLPGGNQLINAHIPYANADFPCDIALSRLYENILPLPLFHCGRLVELDAAPSGCVYIKRRAWDAFGGFAAGPEGFRGNIQKLCEFIVHVLKMKIIYSPEAVVHLPTT